MPKCPWPHGTYAVALGTLVLPAGVHVGNHGSGVADLSGLVWVLLFILSCSDFVLFLLRRSKILGPL